MHLTIKGQQRSADIGPRCSTFFASTSPDQVQEDVQSWVIRRLFRAGQWSPTDGQAERDHASKPVRCEGIGELGISGAGAAIANTIFNACGVRVLDYPIAEDKLLAGLPPMCARHR